MTNVVSKQMLLVFVGLLIGVSATAMYFKLVSSKSTPQEISATLVHQVSDPANNGLMKFTFDVGNDCILKMKTISDDSRGSFLISPELVECKNRPTTNPLSKEGRVTKVALVTTQIVPPFYFNPQKDSDEILIHVNKFDLVEIIRNDI